MNTENKTSESGPNKILQFRKAIGIGLVCLAAIGAVVWLALTGGGGETEVTEVAPEAQAPADLNIGQVIDAITQKDVQAQAGVRYKVVIDDESKTGTAGIAHIGGLVVFVEGTPAVGDVLIIEVTALRDRNANAVIVEKVGTMEVPKRERAGGRTREPSIDGKVYSGVVDDVGAKGDGIVHIGGKVVFIEGATKGQEVTFIITYEGDRFSSGQIITAEEAKQMGGEIVKVEPGTKSAAPAGDRRSEPRRDSPVKVGQAYKGVIAEMSKRGDSGVVRIKGKVVFVPGATVGEEVLFVVENDGRSAATARKISAEEAAGLSVEDIAAMDDFNAAALLEDMPGKTAAAAETVSGEEVVVGKTYSGVIEDIGGKGDGLLHVGTKVVFVPGTTKGQSVTFVVKEDKGRFAVGELVPAQ
ncbi:MAG: hypothetical protein AB7T27_11295 [Kiritimatiellia bacterium]